MSKALKPEDAPRRIAGRLFDLYGEVRRLERRVRKLANKDPSLDKWAGVLSQALVDTEHLALLAVVATDPTSGRRDIEHGNRPPRHPFAVRHGRLLYIATPATGDLDIPDDLAEPIEDQEAHMELIRLPVSRVAEDAIRAAEVATITPEPGSKEGGQA